MIVQKIFTLDRDSFARCGVDSILYLFILRNSVPLFKEIYSSLLKDTPFFKTLMQTIPNISLFNLSPENEIQQNVNAFYSALQDNKTRSDPQCIQNALRPLLVFRSSNIICYTAVFSILRLSFILHPTDTLNDMLIDSCFQYVRMINLMNTPFKSLSKKESTTGSEE